MLDRATRNADATALRNHAVGSARLNRVAIVARAVTAGLLAIVVLPDGARGQSASPPLLLPAAGAKVASQQIIPFWDALGDTTLARLVREALASSPDVRAAAARIRAARARQRLAGLDFVPTVTSAASYTRARLAAAEAPGLPASLRDRNVWSAGLDAAWEVDVFGRIRNNYRGQGALVASAGEDLRFVQVSLVADVASAYFRLRGAQERLAVAQRNAANQQHNLDLTRERLDAGRGTAFDTERARAQLSTTRSSIPAITAEIAADQDLIAALLGRESASDLRAPILNPSSGAAVARAAGADTVLAFPARLSLATPEDLAHNRPDVLAAERLVAAQSSFVAAARAEYLPRLTVGGSLGTLATAFDSLGRGSASRYVIGPVLSWPFLDLGRTRARVDVSRANEEEARQTYRSILLRASSEVSSAMSSYAAARARLADLSDAATASERAAALARLRFTEGVSDFLQVLDAERTQLEAEVQLAVAREQLAVAFATAYRAAGGTLAP